MPILWLLIASNVGDLMYTYSTTMNAGHAKYVITSVASSMADVALNLATWMFAFHYHVLANSMPFILTKTKLSEEVISK